MRHRVDSVKYGAKLQALVYDIFPPTTAIIIFLNVFYFIFLFIQFLSKWTYIHTPGIHTNVKLICADYAMVLQKTHTRNKRKNRQTKAKNNNTQTERKKRRRRKGKNI